VKLSTKFEVSGSNSFEDMFDRISKILGTRDLGHAPFWKTLHIPIPVCQDLAVANFTLFGV